MENFGETSKRQRIWENLILPKDYQIDGYLSFNPVIFFVLSGSISVKINSVETHTVLSNEMFMAQIDQSYEITMIQQTHFLICYIPIEAWYEKWIDNLTLPEENESGKFFKLPVKKVIMRFLSLLDLYLRESVSPLQFFELKRQELFYLLFFYYGENDLARFLQSVLSKDIQFKKIVMNNYLRAKNVQELAKLVNYSTSGFIKKFQKCFNESPYKWMQKQKAKHVSDEIIRGVKSLQEIANEYKFSSYQHFSGFCKSQLGSTPTEILAKNHLKRQ